MCVRVDEPGHNRLASEIDLLRPRSRERADALIVTDSQEATVRDRECLGPRPARVACMEIAVVKNQLGLSAIEREHRSHGKSSKASEELASRLIRHGED